MRTLGQITGVISLITFVAALGTLVLDVPEPVIQLTQHLITVTLAGAWVSIALSAASAINWLFEPE